MGKYLQVGSRSVNGPWLINHEKLEGLSSTINEIYEYLKQDNDLNMEAEVSEKLNTEYYTKETAIASVKESFYYSIHEKKVRVIFKSDKIKEYNSFEKMIMDKDLDDQLIKQLKVTYVLGKSSFKLEIPNRYNDTLEYRVDITEENIKEKALYTLNKWVDNSKSNLFIQVWRKSSGIHWSLIISAILLYIMNLKTPSALYKDHLKNQAFKLLENGIDNNSTNEALRILLEYNSGYIPETFKSTIHSENIGGVLTILLVVGVIIQIAPKTNFFIGKGKNRVKYWELWIRFITFSVPLAIISSVFNKYFELFI